MLREPNRRENDEKTFDMGVICMMLYPDTVSLLPMNSCRSIKEGLINTIRRLSLKEHCINEVRKCFSCRRATCKITSLTARRCRSDMLKDAVWMDHTSDGVKSTPTSRILRLFKSPPTPPQKPFSTSKQST